LRTPFSSDRPPLPRLIWAASPERDQNRGLSFSRSAICAIRTSSTRSPFSLQRDPPRCAELLKGTPSSVPSFRRSIEGLPLSLRRTSPLFRFVRVETWAEKRLPDTRSLGVKLPLLFSSSSVFFSNRHVLLRVPARTFVIAFVPPGCRPRVFQYPALSLALFPNFCFTRQADASLSYALTSLPQLRI